MRTDQSRRKFVKSASVLGIGLVVVPGVTLHTVSKLGAAAKISSSQVRWGLLIDTNKCTSDCTACVTACNNEHNLSGNSRPETDAQWIRKVDISDDRVGNTTSLPVLCQHCETPPCVDVCPTGASFKREDGIVLVNKHTCIGCRYCMMACPYKARSFVHEPITDSRSYSPRGKGTVESCTFCVHRIDNGMEPACVVACHKDGKGAMTFGNLNDPDSQISKLLNQLGGQKIRADLGLNTGVNYHGL